MAASHNLHLKLKDKTRCKRRVAAGRRFCWQHLTDGNAKWRSLTRVKGDLLCGLISLVLGIPRCGVCYFRLIRLRTLRSTILLGAEIIGCCASYD